MPTATPNPHPEVAHVDLRRTERLPLPERLPPVAIHDLRDHPVARAIASANEASTLLSALADFTQEIPPGSLMTEAPLPLPFFVMPSSLVAPVQLTPHMRRFDSDGRHTPHEAYNAGLYTDLEYIRSRYLDPSGNIREVYGLSGEMSAALRRATPATWRAIRNAAWIARAAGNLMNHSLTEDLSESPASRLYGRALLSAPLAFVAEWLYHVFGMSERLALAGITRNTLFSEEERRAIAAYHATLAEVGLGPDSNVHWPTPTVLTGFRQPTNTHGEYTYVPPAPPPTLRVFGRFRLDTRRDVVRQARTYLARSATVFLRSLYGAHAATLCDQTDVAMRTRRAPDSRLPAWRAPVPATSRIPAHMPIRCACCQSELVPTAASGMSAVVALDNGPALGNAAYSVDQERDVGRVCGVCLQYPPVTNYSLAREGFSVATPDVSLVQDHVEAGVLSLYGCTAEMDANSPGRVLRAVVWRNSRGYHHLTMVHFSRSHSAEETRAAGVPYPYYIPNQQHDTRRIDASPRVTRVTIGTRLRFSATRASMASVAISARGTMFRHEPARNPSIPLSMVSGPPRPAAMRSHHETLARACAACGDHDATVRTYTIPLTLLNPAMPLFAGIGDDDGEPGDHDLCLSCATNHTAERLNQYRNGYNLHVCENHGTMTVGPCPICSPSNSVMQAPSTRRPPPVPVPGHNTRVPITFLRASSESTLASAPAESHDPYRQGPPDTRLYLGWELEFESADGALTNSARDRINRMQARPLTRGAIHRQLLADQCPPWPSIVKHDGSLQSGLELVSSPGTMAYWHEQLPVVDRLLTFLRTSGARSFDTTTCGLHVHASLTAFQRPDHVRRLLYFVYGNPVLSRVISQRSPSSLDRWCSLNEPSETLERKARDLSNSHRYAAINLSPHGTAEFRLFRGTLHLPSFFKALEFVTAAHEFTMPPDTGPVPPVSMLTAEAFALFVGERAAAYPHLAAFLVRREVTSTDEPDPPANPDTVIPATTQAALSAWLETVQSEYGGSVAVASPTLLADADAATIREAQQRARAEAEREAYRARQAALRAAQASISSTNGTNSLWIPPIRLASNGPF